MFKIKQILIISNEIKNFGHLVFIACQLSSRERMRMGLKINWLKSSYDDLIPAIDDFFINSIQPLFGS